MQFIPAFLSPAARARLAGPRNKVTKAALRRALVEDPSMVEFISASTQHRSGSWFTVAEAVTHYGPEVSIEVHDRQDPYFLAVVRANGRRVTVA